MEKMSVIEIVKNRIAEAEAALAEGMHVVKELQKKNSALRHEINRDKKHLEILKQGIEKW